MSIGILIANLWILPASMRTLRSLVTQVRTDLISQVLQPGRFSSPEAGLSFHIRDRSMTGDLLGLLVHDERDPKQIMTYLADRGRIVSNDDGAYLVMFDGNVHRFNKEEESKGAQIVNFDQYMLDLVGIRPEAIRARISTAGTLSQRADQSRPQRLLAKRSPGQLRHGAP